MKLKLDENLGEACRALLEADGHDVAMVAQQSMSGAEDAQLIETCQRERRALVTLDLDFSNPILFPPNRYSGIAVLRPGPKPAYEDLISTAKAFAAALRREELDGKLWSVERFRVRIYQQPDAVEDS